ncbi:hypothetical protein AVEN_168299-1 [Araneus ventricosus]|uniref:Uncharacterized protein n=1 Tax=Araneus ventricosus TaxID=182803 RepID=A0A4Y2Q7G8_ARAVE|nr:hypothetical protein AVEN_15872-1 [Araneus ventricosus]GBN59305.1 hypothetical protein AVEN_34181-1 [Araneus ventricosus]GBN59338.1 hypothetical protein AVEN_80693-1 [Araneus ventricosus]GBN59374.1 hypothetical protein AVEN_168299-1 [Araneus ventricosus]
MGIVIQEDDTVTQLARVFASDGIENSLFCGCSQFCIRYALHKEYVRILKSVNESQNSILIFVYSAYSGCNSNRNINSDNKVVISFRKRGESLILVCSLKYNYVRFKINNDVIPIQVLFIYIDMTTTLSILKSESHSKSTVPTLKE